MRDTNHYTIIYSLGYRKLMFLKEGGSYSILSEDKSPDNPDVMAYTEVIVPADALEEAISVPSSDEEATVGEKMQLLFGNYDGFDNFIKFCDENNIETMTLFWD
jgi:hypothetical protein